MTRSRQSAKQLGAATERHVADHLAKALEDDRIDRRVKRGILDRGDISGVRVHGQRLVIEVKYCAPQDLPGWTDEAQIEPATMTPCAVSSSRNAGATATSAATGST